MLLVFSATLQAEINAQQISVIKVYPSTLRIEKGKSKTLTAVAFDAGGNYVQNLNFNFFSSDTNIVSVEKSREGSMEPSTYFSKNLAEVRTGNSAGTTSVYASLNGINSNAVTVLVDDPAANPFAVINGDNDISGGESITAKVGEPIEINAENSRGVKTIEWNWGDGDKSTDLLSATHAYLQAGSYALQLTVKNSSGTTAVSSLTVNIQDHLPCDASNTINVTSVSALQTAYNNLTSAGGQCILLPPGVYDGNLVLQPKNFNEYVTIGTTAAVPELRNRITNTSPALATIRSAVRNVEALRINNGIPGGSKAGKLRFVGLKFDPKNDDYTTDADAYYVIQIGEFRQTVAAHNPEKIIFQHCVIDPPNNIEVVHAVLNNGYKVSIISSWLGNIKTRHAGDSQAIFGLSGRGSHVYNNNFLEAGSENILYGGTGCITNGCAIDGIVTSNIEIRRNFFTKRLSWRTDYQYGEISVKNLFETKTGRRIYAEGNLMTNHWDDYENQGHALIFKSAVGSGSGGYLWNITEDVVFENNRISHIQGGIATVRDVDSGEISNYNPLKVSNIKFKNNLFDDASVERSGSPGGRMWFIYMTGVNDLSLDHVTMIDPRDNIAENGERALYADNINSYRPQITNSIIALNQYGFFSSCGGGSAALNFGGGGGVPDPCTVAVSPSWVISTNVFPKIGDHNINSYPVNNSYPENYSGVGLANYTRCDSNTEPCDQPISNFECVGGLCDNTGSDGQDRGAIIPVLAQRTACTEFGIGANCASTPTQTTYSGSIPLNIPITLEVENFDRGGQGTAYNDASGTTGSGAYRSDPTEAVDLYSGGNASNGFAVNEAAAGEWLEYTINVPVARRFDIGVRYSSEFNNGTFHIEDCGSDPNNQICAGVNLTGTLTAVSTGSSKNFRVLTKRGIRLSAGTHVLRLKMDTNSPEECGCAVANFDAIRFLPTLFDFDNDGRADSPVFRPLTSTWYVNQSRAGFAGLTFGLLADVVVPGDYDGDGRTDAAVFRQSTGTWYLQRSSRGFTAVLLGQSGDIPVPADYDGDAQADVAVWRPSNGFWYYIRSSDGVASGGQLGQNGDKPSVGDFDGDGKSDLAVFRPSNGYWYRINSSDNSVSAIPFGDSSDKITPADYDGDGKTDIAVFRPSNSTWYRTNSSNGQQFGTAYGAIGDVPVPADYDGDGKVDIAVFRPSNGVWYLFRSTEKFGGNQFGQSGDIPIPSIFVR